MADEDDNDWRWHFISKTLVRPPYPTDGELAALLQAKAEQTRDQAHRHAGVEHSARDDPTTTVGEHTAAAESEAAVSFLLA